MNDFLKVMLFVLIGTAAMLIPMSLVTWRYRIQLYKGVLVALYAALCGTISTYLWFFVENHFIGGISFFGAVFLMPVAFYFAPRIFREPFGDLMDMFAPGICMMLAVMKVQCLLSGCCRGRELHIGDMVMQFPSQLAEMVNGLVLMAILLTLAMCRKGKGKLYPLFMILYGCTRFVLQIFREEWVTHTGVLPTYGTIWSVLAVIIGAVWLWKMHKKEKIQEQVQPEA